MKIDLPVDRLTKCLHQKLEECCWCQFDKHKPKLKELRDLLNKRWDEPIDPHCIE